jgi:ribosomal protein S12 methylthiotransferase
LILSINSVLLCSQSNFPKGYALFRDVQKQNTLKTKTLRKDKVNVITLGCSKNLVDSEDLITQLKGNDYEVSHESEEEDANIIIVNTCGFIDLAKEESVNTILQYAEVKKQGGIDKLYVTGCLSQRYKDNLEAEIPEVDAFFGTLEMPALLAKLEADYKHELIGERFTTTPQHFAYVKISEGCNRTCSFCAIPLMRGKHISKSIEALVTEAKNLARLGVKEIMLIAQELTYYGLDLYKERALPQLLEALAGVEGIEWIRLHYAYPSKFPMEIFDAMKKHPNVCNYLDMPLQHASDSVLERMRRQITQKETRVLCNEARERIPGIAIRTTLLVGFPGETEEEFQELCDFVEDMRFERVGVFQYSHEEDTRAHTLEDDIPAEVKAERANRIMDIQREISFEKNEEKIGQTLKVLFDRKEGEYFVGRTESDSPEVDNEVLVAAENQYVRIGDFAMVKITGAEDFDLYGDVVV